MRNTFDIGRIFYGIAITGLGLISIYYGDFPYMLIPPKHSWIPGMVIILAGLLFVLAGLSIISKKRIVQFSLYLGGALLLIFLFYFVPYQLNSSANYLHLVDWENSLKELSLAGGAFVIAHSFPRKNINPAVNYLNRIVPYGTILFSIPIICFGTLHFLYAKDVADYVPSWVPYHLFWTYLAGAGLLASGIAIALRIKSRLAATLLGAMIFTWFVILHVPRVIVSPAAYLSSEISSALLALAYSGIAFLIAAGKS